MRLTLSTYNGTSITTYAAKIPGTKPVGLEASLISVARVNDLSAYGGKSFQAITFDVIFTVGITASTRNTNIEAVGKLFDPKDSTLRTLVATDGADSDTQYYIECTPVTFPQVDGSTMTVKMWTNDPVWKKVSSSTKTISVLGTGTTSDTVTNGGNLDAYPSIAITPTSTGGAYSYRRHVIVYNPIAYAQNNYPIDLTSGGFDTSALAKDATVSNQINVVGGITAVATTWAIDTPVGGGLATGGGTFMMESEQCSYTSIAAGVINGVTRGINGTTAAVHADNVVMYRSLIQADGDDIRLKVDGWESERWLGGTPYSDTTLKVWGVFDFAPGQSATLQTALNSSNETVITFKNTTANIKALKAMPEKGMVLIDSEVIAYTARNITKRQLTIANNGRGIKDTSAASHSANATIRWIQYDIILIYGNLNAETPVQTDTRKPCFSLDNSTNTNWRWDSADSVFGDEAGLRSGSWKPSKPVGVYSDWYGGNQGTFGTDPFTEMGAEITSYLAGGPYKAEQAVIYWTLSNNAGITTLSSLGEKYKYATTTPFPVCRLESSVNGVKWVIEWSETTPASAATWTSWTHASETLATGAKYARFVFAGAVNAVANAVARNEVNLGSAGSMGAVFTTANVPQITLVAQATNAEINITLANTTTGESLEYSFPLAANTTLIIDTENRTVSYQDRLVAPPELSSVRQEWLRLQSGNNTVTYTDSSTGTVTVVFTWKNRKNI